jgi:ADP-ribose pyrophosphatase YjhB (NUDIX family)
MSSRPLSPAEQIAAWSDRLRDLSALGLMYNQNLHDRESYQAIQDIALQMLALASGEMPEEIEPLRGPFFTRPTPLAVGDGAVIDEQGRVLLIRRSDNRLWAMPGGALQVGEAPAEGTVREVLEETGISCEPIALVGVFDSRLCGAVTRFHLYQFVFLCRPLPGVPNQPPSHAIESLEIAWFAESALPPNLDPGHATRLPHAFRMWRGDRLPFFDRPT